MEQFEPGSLVRTRGRDWIVVPSEQEGLLHLRPVTVGGAEEAALFLDLERAVQSATFPEPSRERFGDAASLIALFNATRLSLRSGAAPFRSLGQISVIPRPYQFVPLLMALRLTPVRLLVADDVGVGKTIEAALIARELLDRGIARRLAVICPAHLCDQWARELEEKFALAPHIIQPSTVARLERRLPRRDLSIYGWPRCFVASIDFVKSQQQRDRLLRHLPDLVIVDEAHTAARPRGDRGRAQQQRHELLRAIAQDAGKHLILVTATPHSGIEESFRSLLGLLNPGFERLGVDPQADRRRLLPHIVQRRRRDVERWMGAETPFPERIAEEVRYTLPRAMRACSSTCWSTAARPRKPVKPWATLSGASGIGR